MAEPGAGTAIKGEWAMWWTAFVAKLNHYTKHPNATDAKRQPEGEVKTEEYGQSNDRDKKEDTEERLEA